ncbi:MAG TPA: MBOAT family O-acyltransferase [Acidimicrobiales bacterium]
MSFASVAFAAFFPVVLVGSWLLRPRPTVWTLFVLAASYVFVGWFDWRATVVVMGVTVCAHLLAQVASRANGPVAHTAVAVAVSAGIALIWWSRAGGLLDDAARRATEKMGGAAVVEVVLPLALGLLVLQAVGYVSDAARGRRLVSLVDLALVLSFFPRVATGPLVSTQEFAASLHAPADPREVPAAPAFRLILTGLAMKLVVADNLAVRIVDPVFADPGAHSAQEALAAIYGWTVQLFADIGGAVAIGVGAAMLMGVAMPSGFDAPLVAGSPTQLWARWHGTVTDWWCRNVAQPLGVRHRVPAALGVVVVTFVLAGLWVRWSWSLALWGVLMGAAVALETHLGRAGRLPHGRWFELVGWVLTLNLAALTWTLWRVASPAGAVDVLARLAHWGDSPLVTPAVLALIVAPVALQLVPRRVVVAMDMSMSRVPPLVQGVSLGLALFAVLVLRADRTTPFLVFSI